MCIITLKKTSRILYYDNLMNKMYINTLS